MGGEGGVEGGLATGRDFGDAAVEDVSGREKRQPVMVVVVVVPLGQPRKVWQ